MKKTIHTLLVIAAVVSVVLLFWPFAEWNDTMTLILRMVPALAVQALLCGTCKSKILTFLPALLTGTFAAWGTYLYFTSPHWANATAADLIADYVSPFICCVVVWAAYLPAKRK